MLARDFTDCKQISLQESILYLVFLAMQVFLHATWLRMDVYKDWQEALEIILREEHIAPIYLLT